MSEISSHQCPPHWWLIGNDGIGRCKYCPATKDFRELGQAQLEETREAGRKGGRKHKGVRGKSGRRKPTGRPPEYA